MQVFHRKGEYRIERAIYAQEYGPAVMHGKRRHGANTHAKPQKNDKRGRKNKS